MHRRLVDGFGHPAADIQADGRDQQADQEGHAPAPLLQRVRRERGGEGEADDAGGERRHALAGRLPGAVEAAPARRCRLQQVGRGRPHLAAGGETLDEAGQQHQEGRRDPDAGVGGGGGQNGRAQGHEGDGERERRLAAMAVGKGADEHPAERPRDVAGAVGADGEQQARERILRREKGPADHDREEGVDGEVIELERVAEDGCNDRGQERRRGAPCAAGGGVDGQPVHHGAARRRCSRVMAPGRPRTFSTRPVSS